jgi:GDP-L-fucose synthase
MKSKKILVNRGAGLIWNVSKPNGQPERCLDIKKAEIEFGFVAKTVSREGVTKTIQWYKKSKNPGIL